MKKYWKRTSTTRKACDRWLACFFCWFAIAAFPAAAKEPDLAVLYPHVREPYLSVLHDIIRGVDNGHEGQVVEYVITQDSVAGEIDAWLGEYKISSVVALGNNAATMMQELNGNYTSVAGAILSFPNIKDKKIASITLMPDPELLFQQLLQLVPDIKTVSVFTRRGFLPKPPK